jgi:RNA polymerase sigma-70 factor (ECF subfamily)
MNTSGAGTHAANAPARKTGIRAADQTDLLGRSLRNLGEALTQRNDSEAATARFTQALRQLRQDSGAAARLDSLIADLDAEFASREALDNEAEDAYRPSVQQDDDAESLRMLALVELAQDGDGEAFGQLYDAYSDTVYRYIYYRVSNKPLAEDLTSETFLRALRRISTFTWQGRDFGAWLVTIARALVADHFKSSRYRLEVPTGEMLDSDQTESSPEDSVLAYLSNKVLLDAVCQLNSQQQECVTLRFLHGLSVAETAKIMGKNDGAIKTLQYRAIRTLARLLPADTLR